MNADKIFVHIRQVHTEKLPVMERFIVIYTYISYVGYRCANRKQKWRGNTKYRVSKCLLRANLLIKSLPKKLFVLLPIDNIQRVQV